ncbi:MAG: peptidase S8 [Candidatus Meridianibacter frigidus]|nr:MAG: peptidase S8 [Candidatus Eremiobacteraeota bacterium]
MSGRRFASVLAGLFALAACSGHVGDGSVAAPASPADSAVPSAPAVSAQSNFQPPPSKDGAHGLPGGSGYIALPGESAHGLPGANFACSPPWFDGQAQCTIAINLNVRPNPNAGLPAASIPGLHPSDLASAYKLLVGGGAQRTIAIVDAYDDPAAEADLAVYRAAFGLPPCASATGCFKKVNQRGQTWNFPPLDPGWAQETALDLDMVSAACPKCKLVLVEANSSLMNDLGAGVDCAASFHPISISNSYYAWEWASEGLEEVHYHHPGIAVTVSSGDHHYQSYPAASRYVTAVGGTTLNGKPGSWTESPWTFSGGGCSAYIAKAFTQPGSTCMTRAAVDVAAVADPNTGVSVFSSLAGGWIVAGGTSVGAPLVAAAYALAGRGDGPSYSYSHATAFHDVLPRGFDLKTGLGAPSGVAGL